MKFIVFLLLISCGTVEAPSEPSFWICACIKNTLPFGCPPEERESVNLDTSKYFAEYLGKRNHHDGQCLEEQGPPPSAKIKIRL